MNNKKTKNVILQNPRNREVIYNHYKETNNLQELHDMYNALETYDDKSIEMEELRNIVNERINELENKDLKEVVNEAKKDNSYINNFEILDTPKEINDKDNYGFRNDVSYLKVNISGKVRIFEIEPSYIDIIKNFFTNSESLKDLTENDILDKLLPYIKELEQVNLDRDTNLDKETVQKEINNIYDNDVKSVFTKNIDEVIKERELLNKYMQDNGLLNIPLSYALNSKGERLYILGDKTIKFVGENKEMYFLKQSGNEKVKENNKENNIENKDTKDVNNLNNNENQFNNNDINNIPDNLYDLDNEFYINAINFSMEKIYNTEPLTEYEEKLIEVFFALCVQVNENEIPQPLFEIYDTYTNYLKENPNDYYNDNIKGILEPNVNKKIEEENKEKENKDNRSLVLENKETGFVNIIYIICSIIMVILGILYLIFIR